MQADESSGTAVAEPTTADDSRHKYLLFSLQNELYGTPLISIREVLKLGVVKPVPYMANHFIGVINLRGLIVSIVDLRIKFGLVHEPQKTGLVIVIETRDGVIGAVIDDLMCVKVISPKDIEKHPNLDTRIPLRFYLGIAKTDHGLVNLVDAAGVLVDGL